MPYLIVREQPPMRIIDAAEDDLLDLFPAEARRHFDTYPSRRQIAVDEALAALKIVAKNSAEGSMAYSTENLEIEVLKRISPRESLKIPAALSLNCLFDRFELSGWSLVSSAGGDSSSMVFVWRRKRESELAREVRSPSPGLSRSQAARSKSPVGRSRSPHAHQSRISSTPRSGQRERVSASPSPQAMPFLGNTPGRLRSSPTQRPERA